MLAQGATEYLVLLAVVLIIALVGVALLGFFPGTASDAQIAESQIYWQSASPIAITEWAANATACSSYSPYGAAYDGGGPYLRIRNTGMYPISITALLTGDPPGRTYLMPTCNYTPACPPPRVNRIAGRVVLQPGGEDYFGAAFAYPGLAPRGDGNEKWLFFTNGTGNYFQLNVETPCQNTSPYGYFKIKDLTFEYDVTIEGQTITKRQNGKDVVIKCTGP